MTMTPLVRGMLIGLLLIAPFWVAVGLLLVVIW
jgi:hypothetical protein